MYEATTPNATKYYSALHLTRAPTLLLGIGGIGGEIVKGVYDAMLDVDKTYVEMIVMDTNVSDLRKFENSGIEYIQTSENQTVQDYLAAHPEFIEWFPTNPLINDKNLTQGAGQIRSVSRLGALASKGEGSFAAIDRAVDRIRKNHGDSLNSSVRVMIVGSVTGGTGAGLAIQLPFYVRNVLESKGVPNVLVRGMFIMPSITEDKQDTESKEKAVNVNGYAFLKELNAFYRLQQASIEDNNLRIEEYVPGVKTVEGMGKEAVMAAPVPYNYMFLVEEYGKKGTIGDLEDYIARCSQMVLNQLFSPVAERGFSVEDNLITSLVEKKGMSKYCGAGISNIIYPKNEVVRYCTVRYAGQMLKDYWLQIDEEFKIKDEHQSRLKKTNPQLESLDKGKTYCTIFDDMCNPEKRTVSSDIAALQRELSFFEVIEREDGSKKKEEKQVVDSLISEMKKYCRDVFESTGVFEASKDCNVLQSELKRGKDKAKNIMDERLTEFRELRKKVDKAVNDSVSGIAEAILPSDFKLAKGIKETAKYSIFTVLRNKHPIVVRYLLYKLRDELKKEKIILDNNITGYKEDEEKNVFNYDFFKEGEEDIVKEGPIEAIDKTKLGVFNKTQYVSLVEEIEKVHNESVTKCLLKAEDELSSLVYSEVLGRIQVLIELYENFFGELKEIMIEKEEEAKRLETGRGEGKTQDFKGDKYVCSNKPCKDFLYNKFVSSISDSDMEMSEEVKCGFFDKMFEEYDTRLKEKNSPTAYITHISLRDLFEEGILEPITNQFSKTGFKHLDMSILEAIRQQFEIENRSNGLANDDEAFKNYLNALWESARSLADPYLMYKKDVGGVNSTGKLSYFWGFNYSAVARYQFGDVNAVIDNQKLKSLIDRKDETVLCDNSFAPTVITCYCAIYDLCIENCVSYLKGSKPQKCYAERLNNYVNTEYVVSNDEEAYLNVIHPHLDCRWHEHAYLPELMKWDEEKMSKDICMAFLLSLALKRCYYKDIKEEYLECWWFRKSDEKNPTPVYVNGKELKSKVMDEFYNALDNNRLIVEDVIKYAETIRSNAKAKRPESGITDAVILEHKIIKALIGSENTKNAIDRIYDLYSAMGNRNIIQKMVAALDEYLMAYCMDMVNGNVNKATHFCDVVKKAIGDGSKKLKATDVSDIFKEYFESYKK